MSRNLKTNPAPKPSTPSTPNPLASFARPENPLEADPIEPLPFATTKPETGIEANEAREIGSVRVDELESLRELRREVVNFLENQPDAIRVREGDRVLEGDRQENLAMSLATTVASMRTRLLPRELTPELREVLAFDAQDAQKIALRFRLQGAQIDETFESEHSFVVFWLLGFVIVHGANWRREAAAVLPKLPPK